MKAEQEYIKDITAIRSMMERSTRFLSLTGWSGIMAGIYALIGAYLAYANFYTTPEGTVYGTLNPEQFSGSILNLILLALAILVLALGTAVFLSSRKSTEKGEKLWNPAARRLILNMAIPLVTGGIFILILILKGLLDLMAPLTLIFYGLALINASKFTYEELKYLGLIEIVLGLTASQFTAYGIFLWATGFGVMHIVYGIYMYLKLEK
ncbi:hypothetical protein [Autumnicola edwardsiae]|uniref:Uncharacterized protein n=1 Tax=Autumnicola edwardsiae TaxID=3075594 RepID=A0ABU3CVE0_9FLAO|nr:hypothetical protein [Zunongwangia sp. F297]MDT0650332.1 hypothetical protein [Zunongwangia sp. F297]